MGLHLYTEGIKGGFKTRVEIWCGTCGRFECLAWTKGVYCKQEAKERGWKKTKEFGWVCPNCLSKK